MHSCPTCGKDFETDRGMKIHHSRSHGESIASDEADCQVCGTTFDYYSSMQKGDFCSYECSYTAREGENNPMKRPEVQEKNSRSQPEQECPWEGEPLPWADACRGPRPSMTGENHPNWQGGSVYYYGPSWTEELRESVRERDDYTCQRCGFHHDVLDETLNVHHRIPFREFGIERHEEANQPENLVSLCDGCHIIIERSEPSSV